MGVERADSPTLFQMLVYVSKFSLMLAIGFLHIIIRYTSSITADMYSIKGECYHIKVKCKIRNPAVTNESILIVV